MRKSDTVFTPMFIANLFLIASIVFLLLWGKMDTYVGDDGMIHQGNMLMFIGCGFLLIAICIWIIVWIKKRRKK